MTRWLLLLFVPALAAALDPSLAISQYTYEHWQVEEGLPQNYVTAIAQARVGRPALRSGRPSRDRM